MFVYVQSIPLACLMKGGLPGRVQAGFILSLAARVLSMTPVFLAQAIVCVNPMEPFERQISQGKFCTRCGRA